MHLLTDLGIDLKIFDDSEKKIIAARQRGASLCDLEDSHYEIALTGICFNISVISGCPLPTHEAHINALEKELSNFLKENGYTGLTVEEILTAFRMNANYEFETRVEHYNVVLNIDYVAKIIRQYVRKRSGVDTKSEQVFERRIWDEALKKEDDARRVKIINQFELFLKDDNAALDLSNCFMQLREDGAFSNKSILDDKNPFIGSTEFERLSNSFEGLDARFEKEHELVRFLFKQMKLTGKDKIYDENLKLIYPGLEV